jgi:SAM-dependent methyltransferase
VCASGPPADPEVARVRGIYAGYGVDPKRRKRWDAGNPGNAAVWLEFQKETLTALRRAGVCVDRARVLDVGCGRGAILAWLRDLGAASARLHGVDLLYERVAEARVAHPHARYLCADGRRLPFSDHFFDVVLTINVFSSILDDAVAVRVASEAQRVLKPGGVIVWCDSRYPNPWNPHYRGYSRRRLERLFPGCGLELQSITVAPPVIRPLGAAVRRLYPVLARVPFLRVRYLGIIRPSGPSCKEKNLDPRN